jgi:streptomycin 6-kinase
VTAHQPDGSLELPRRLLESLDADENAARRAWAARLPGLVDAVAGRWGLRLGRPFQPGGMCSWVAPVRTADGRHLVLKVGWAEEESAHELEGLLLWAGDGTVRVERGEKRDDTTYLLLERGADNHDLSREPPEVQDQVVAGLLRRLWVQPPAGHPFRPLAQMCDGWADEALARPQPFPFDPGIARAGLELFRTLPTEDTEQRLLLTDLHAENVLRGEREPWLVIDPKPYVGDPAYDPLQHLLNLPEQLRADPDGRVARLADLCGVDRERLRLWLFARCVVEWPWFELDGVAEALAP